MNIQNLFKRIDTKKEILLAIDGKCGSGKTTLSNILKEKYDCSVFHMDDFFLQPYQRTESRYKEPGGNVDYERFESEILIPLSQKRDVYYSKFNCKKMELEPKIFVPYKPINIIEGSYSMHPNLQKYYTTSIYLQLNEKERLNRIKKRNPDTYELFIHRWIPLENLYFDTFHIQEKCDYTIITDHI